MSGSAIIIPNTYADSHPRAAGGFAGPDGGPILEVRVPEELLSRVPLDKREALLGVLSHDPRPPYQQDPDRVYGLDFAGLNIRFSVQDQVLTVRALQPLPK